MTHDPLCPAYGHPKWEDVDRCGPCDTIAHDWDGSPEQLLFTRVTDWLERWEAMQYNYSSGDYLVACDTHHALLRGLTVAELPHPIDRVNEIFENGV